MPALMLGTCIVYALRNRLKEPIVLAVTGILYLFAMLGESYYGLLPLCGGLLSTLYDSLFRLNGNFYFALGAAAANRTFQTDELPVHST
jgi:serine/alanine racemase